MPLPALSVCAVLLAAAATAASAPAPAGLRLVSPAAGKDELWRGTQRLGEVKLGTPGKARGLPRVRELTVEGHPVIELLIPIAGRNSAEGWVGTVAAEGLSPIFSGVVGARDSDGETGRELSVSAQGIFVHDTVARLSRCDGRPVRLHRQRFDFAAAKLVDAGPDLPPPAATTLKVRRGGGKAPAERPRLGFPFALTSAPPLEATTQDAQALVAPTALNDGDPRTVWLEGAPGDGRGEILTARPAGPSPAVVGLRLLPGDTRSRAHYARHARARAIHLALGPAPEQQFEVVLEDDAGDEEFRRPYWVALPRPVPASCVTVTVREVRRGNAPREAEVAAWGDIEVFTNLDGPAGPGRLVKALGEAGCESRIGDVVVLGPTVLPALAEALAATAAGPQRDCLIEALAGIGAAPGRLAGPARAALQGAVAQALLDATAQQEKLLGGLVGTLDGPSVDVIGTHLRNPALGAPARVRMARLLARLPGERSQEALLTAAGQGPPELRAALRELISGRTGMPPARVAAALNETTAERDPTGSRRADLAEILGQVAARAALPGPRASATSTLTALASDEQQPFELRARALRGLAHVGDEAALAALVGIRAASGDPVVRLLAVRGLASNPRPAALPALREAVADSDPAVRETAVVALGRRGDRQAAAAIIAGAKQEPWPAVRRAEITALGEVCGDGAGDLFVRAIERDVDDVRRAAAAALVTCKEPRARSLLLDLLARERETPALRSFAAGQLGRLGDPAAVADMAETLEQLVLQSQTDLALEATALATLRALGAIGGPAAGAAALSLRDDPRPTLRRSVIETLARVCDGPAAAALRQATQDKDEGVASAAAAGLRRCGVAAQGSRPGAGTPGGSEARR